MVAARHLRAGHVTGTDRAHAVAARFESEGVPLDQISVNDSLRPVVAVQEATDGDLAPDAFSAFMRACNALVNDSGGARFATTDEKCVIVPHGYVDNEIMSDSTDSEATEQDDGQYAVMHHGGNRFSVLDRESGQSDDDDAPRVYRVDMDAKNNGAAIETPNGQPEVESGAERNGVVAAVIEAGPTYRPGPQESLTVNVGNASTGSSGDSSGNSTDHSNVDPVTDPGDHDHDEDALIECVDDWLSNYAGVKGDMHDGWWDLSFNKMTNPQSGESELGVYIKVEPFAHEVWNNSDGAWASDDKKDEWTDHTAAMRSVFSSDDDPVKGFSVTDDDSEYDDWFNYVPATEAGDL